MNPFANEKNAAPVIPAVKQPEPQPEKAIAPTVILTPIDAYLHQRASAQTTTLDEVDVKFEGNKRPDVHRLSLPKELTEYEKRFAFRWLFKHKQAIDHALDQRGWELVNITRFRDLPKHLFASTGLMERGDNVLAFMPLRKAQELRKAPGDLSRQIVEGTLNKHKDNPDFYVPSDSDDKRVVGL